MRGRGGKRLRVRYGSGIKIKGREGEGGRRHTSAALLRQKQNDIGCVLSSCVLLDLNIGRREREYAPLLRIPCLVRSSSLAFNVSNPPAFRPAPLLSWISRDRNAVARSTDEHGYSTFELSALVNCDKCTTGLRAGWAFSARDAVSRLLLRGEIRGIERF